MNDSQKYKVISLLQQNVEPKDIAEELDISYSAILRLRREFKEAKTNNTIDQLLDVDKVILSEVDDKLASLSDLGVNTKSLTNGVEGLETLGVQFQQTATLINTQVKSLIMSIDHMSELEIAADILCKLQTAFLNKNMTQVNVQNNFGSDGSPKYTQFLGDKPSD